MIDRDPQPMRHIIAAEFAALCGSMHDTISDALLARHYPTTDYDKSAKRWAMTERGKPAPRAQQTLRSVVRIRQAGRACKWCHGPVRMRSAGRGPLPEFCSARCKSKGGNNTWEKIRDRDRKASERRRKAREQRERHEKHGQHVLGMWRFAAAPKRKRWLYVEREASA